MLALARGVHLPRPASPWWRRRSTATIHGASPGRDARGTFVSTSTIIAAVVFSLLVLMCGGGGLVLLLLFVVGLILLRRRGQKDVTARDAVKAGAESVSQMFMRTKDGNLAPMDEDDDD